MIFALLTISFSLLQQEQSNLTACQCDQQDLGDLFCQDECNTEQCNFDNGDCDQAICACDPSLIGDGICQWQCVSNACNWDAGDCCQNWMLYNDFCDAQCYLEQFQYDMDSCFFHVNDCACKSSSIGDGDCIFQCSGAADCIYDFGDCCFEFEVGDGHCQQYCYAPIYNWDEGDCFKNAPVDCPCWGQGLLGTGECNEDCNTEECWYDMGDCCYQEMLGDSVCNPECNDSVHFYDEGDCCDQENVGNSQCDPECDLEMFEYDGGDCED